MDTRLTLTNVQLVLRLVLVPLLITVCLLFTSYVLLLARQLLLLLLFPLKSSILD